jgi:hypothetical protein
MMVVFNQLVVEEDGETNCIGDGGSAALEDGEGFTMLADIWVRSRCRMGEVGLM